MTTSRSSTCTTRARRSSPARARACCRCAPSTAVASARSYRARCRSGSGASGTRPSDSTCANRRAAISAAPLGPSRRRRTPRARSPASATRRTASAVNSRHVGASGLLVSEIGFGTTTLSEAVHGDEAVALVHHALARGITYFDTAVTYSGGRSEEILGEALVGRRGEAVIGTKVGLRAPGTGEHTYGLSRRRIMEAIETSLRRLRTDHVDLYMAHRPDPTTPVEETLE